MLDDLKNKLEYYCDEYYNNISPISDTEYDKLKDLYEELSGKKFEYVGAYPKSKLKKVKHNEKMLSLDKVNNFNDLKKFLKKGKVCIQHKLDGVSLDLTYKKGLLVRAATRGNGEIGEDVTHNAYVIKNIPNYIEDLKEVESFNVRGEVIIYKSDFERLKKRYKKFKTARNLASGSIRLKDEIKTTNRKLRFIAYECFEEYKNDKDIDQQLKILEHCGFDVVSYTVIYYDGTNFESIGEIVNDLDKTKSALQYDIDGIVIKLNDANLIRHLGETNHHPKWAKAFKFKNEYAITTLKNIEWSISATGRCNPVAVFEPIMINGVTISRATLHNLDIIEALGLTKNCRIMVERANDVIPYISKKVKDITNEPIIISEICPECNCALKRVNQYLVCSNPDCHGVMRTKILAFIKILGIKGLGEKYVRELTEYLIDKEYDYVHLLNIDFDVLYSITRSVKISNKIMDEINNLKEGLSADKALASLFIEGVGITVARKILQKHKYNDLLLLSEIDFKSINGIGKIIAENIYNALNDKKIKQRYNYFRAFIKESSNLTDALKGKYFCITGKLPEKRYLIEKEIHANGGYCTNTISRKVDYLIVGEKPGMKYDFAKREGVVIINYDQYKKLLQG